MLNELANYIIVINFLVWIFYFVVVLPEKRRSDMALIWLLVFVLLPWPAPFLYLLLGYSRTKQKIIANIKKQNQKIDEYLYTKLKCLPRNLDLKIYKKNKNHIDLVDKLSDCNMSYGNQITLCQDQDAYEQMIKEINQAKHHVHLHYYKLDSGMLSNKIFQALISKAKKEVKVRITYESFASRLKAKDIHELKKAGVEIHKFMPWYKRLTKLIIMVLNHRKFMIIDGHTAFVGSHDICDRCVGKDNKFGTWRDSTLKINGPAVYLLQKLFLRDWHFATGQKNYDWKSYFPTINQTKGSCLQIIPEGPDTQLDAIRTFYFEAIATAEESILLTSPYFIPDDAILVGLRTAAISGVDVKLILPSKSLNAVAKLANMANIELLIEAGVKVYLYNPKKYIHSKTMVIDHQLASIGSANLDMRSMFYNYELNAVVYDPKIIKQFETAFNQDLKNCSLLTEKFYLNKTHWQQTKEAIARLFTPLI